MDRRDLSSSSVGKDLKLIANSLRESGSYRGALDLNYRDFARHYEYMSQLVNRSNCRCYLVMVTMETHTTRRSTRMLCPPYLKKREMPVL